MANNVNIKVLVDDAALEKLTNKAQQSAKIIRGGFDIATGAAAVFGSQTAEAFEKIANRSIIVANTFNGLEDLIEGLGKSQGFLNLAQKVGVGKSLVEGFAAALPGIGVAASIVLPLVTEYWDDIAGAIGIANNKTLLNAEAIGKASEKFTSLKTDVDVLVAEYNKSNTSLERQKEIIGELSEISPNYFSTAISNTDQLTAAQSKFNAAILQQITLEGAKSLIAEKQKEFLNQNVELLQEIALLEARDPIKFPAINEQQKEQDRKNASRLKDLKAQFKEGEKLFEQEVKGLLNIATQAQTNLDKLGGDVTGKGTKEAAKKTVKEVKVTWEDIKKETAKGLKNFREGEFKDEFEQYINDTENFVAQGAFIPTPEMIGEAGDKAIVAQGEVADKLAKDRLKKREQDAKDRLKAEADTEKLLFDQRVANLERIAEVANSFSGLADQLFSNALDNIDRQTEAQLKALDKVSEAALKKAGDNAIERARIEEDLAKKRVAIEEEAEQKRKELQKKQALTDLAFTTIQIGVETALAVLKAETLPEKVLNGVLGATALATAIAAKTQVLKLGKGGTLFGPSHAEGGIRGTGAFGGIEVEGGEMIINKRSARMYGPLLSRINQAGGGVPLIPTKAANGAILPGGSFSDLDYDRLAVAIANTPIRAYVVTQDITDAQDKVNIIQRKANLF